MMNSKMYLTQSEAREMGLPSTQEQIDRYNRAVLSAKVADAEEERRRNYLDSLQRSPETGAYWEPVYWPVYGK